jgi:four helix bundle protein
MVTRFSANERFELASQMRRAAVSIPANIAEGFARRRPVDKARFCNIAEGSAEELQYFFILAKDLGYSTDLSAEDTCAGVARMLRRLVDTTLDSVQP